MTRWRAPRSLAWSCAHHAMMNQQGKIRLLRFAQIDREPGCWANASDCRGLSEGTRLKPRCDRDVSAKPPCSSVGSSLCLRSQDSKYDKRTTRDPSSDPNRIKLIPNTHEHSKRDDADRHPTPSPPTHFWGLLSHRGVGWPNSPVMRRAVDDEQAGPLACCASPPRLSWRPR